MRRPIRPSLLRRIIASILLGVLYLDLILWWKAFNPYDPSLERVQTSGILRVGMDPTYPPFATYAGDQIIGLDVDLAHEVAARIGVKVQIVSLGIDGLYDALQSDQVDVLISALMCDPYRLSQVIYTRPYYDAGQVIASLNPDLFTMRRLEGHTVAVEYGSLADELSRRWMRRLRLLDVSRFVTADEALQAALQGKVDAAISDQVTARLFLRGQSDALNLAPIAGQGQPYCAALRVGYLKLAKVINAVLEEIDADQTLAAIIKRWL